jgi:hypothetical protein
MKSIGPLLLIDCGKASKKTRGNFAGAFWEGGVGPTSRWLG